MESTSELVVDEAITIAAAPEAVWDALIDPDARAGWWDYVTLDARVGGAFEEIWTGPDGRPARTSGVVTELVEHRVLELDWADDDWPSQTRVRVELVPVAAATSVRLRHTGWERLPAGAALAAEHRDGWRLHLANLRGYVEDQKQRS